jgi:hypothetical protein
MTTPRHDHRHPSEAALLLVAALPDHEWLSEDEISEVAVAEKIGDTRPLRSVLNEMRRRSWLIRDPHQPSVMWKRTPTGARTAQQIDTLTG